MTARPARTAQGALREMLGAMNMHQLAQAASAAGIPRAQLIAFAEGRAALSEPACGDSASIFIVALIS
jgi:hypothetical protein